MNMFFQQKLIRKLQYVLSVELDESTSFKRCYVIVIESTWSRITQEIPEHQNGAFPAFFLQLHGQPQMLLEIEMANGHDKKQEFQLHFTKRFNLYQTKNKVYYQTSLNMS